MRWVVEVRLEKILGVQLDQRQDPSAARRLARRLAQRLARRRARLLGYPAPNTRSKAQNSLRTRETDKDDAEAHEYFRSHQTRSRGGHHRTRQV